MEIQPIIIGICGGSGSGKTTLALALQSLLGAEKAVFITEDDYYMDVAGLSGFGTPDFDFDNPIIRDHDALFLDLNTYKNGKAFAKPKYDFTNHCRHKETETIIPKKYCIIEGTHVFYNPQIRDIFDFKIFIDAPEAVRFSRRLARDINERGRTEQCVIEQFDKNVRPGHEKWTQPFKPFADFIVENGQNRDANEIETAVKAIINRLETLKGR